MNLNKLKYLTLRGNKLETISDEAFQVFMHFSFVLCPLYYLFVVAVSFCILLIDLKRKTAHFESFK